MLEIDGSQGEGGGQLLRSGLAFSALTGRPFRVHNIRANRSKPGLRPQHLAAVRLTSQLCGARCHGDEVNSTALEFHPGPLRPGRYRQDIGTAGALILLTQATLLPALRAGGPVVLELSGGTDVPMAPPLDYVAQVVLPFYRRLGRIDLEVVRRGFNPKGGGAVRLTIEGHGKAVAPLRLTGSSRWGEPGGQALATRELRDAAVAERMAKAVRKRLSSPMATTYVEADSPGAVITLWCQDLEEGRWTGASTLGRPGLPAERVGEHVASSFAALLTDPRPASEHLADQLIPLLAVTGGEMECQTISEHCATNIEMCRLFSGTRFEVEGTTVRATLLKAEHS